MHHYTHRRVVRKGRKDGRNWRYTLWPFRHEKQPEPKADQEIAPQYEIEIIKASENEISKEAEDWKELDKKLKPDYCEAVTELDNARKMYLKEADEADIAQEEFNAARQKYESLAMPALDLKWRNFWLVFIAIVEFPLNSVVFNVFGESRILTLLFAAGLCVMIPLFGHFWGCRFARNIEIGGIIQ